MKRSQRFLYYAMLILGLLGVLDTIAVSIYTNINTGSILPGLLGLIFIIYSYLKLWVFKGKLLIKNNILRYLIITGIVLFTLSFAIVESLILYNNNSLQNIKTDYLIILGGGVKGKTVSLTLQERLNKGIEYLNQYPDTKVVVSGGKGFEEAISEAEAMKIYLIASGINSSRIIMEDKATSTMENFKFTRDLLTSLGQKDTTKIMVITSDFHMMRSKMLARRNGFEPYGITCSTPASVRLNCYAREYFAIIKSYIFDR